MLQPEMLQPEYQDGLPLAVALENQLGVNRFDSAQSWED